MKILKSKNDKRTVEQIIEDDMNYQEFPDDNYYIKPGETEDQRNDRLLKLGYKEINI